MKESVWNEAISVGIESWDQDHRELLRLIDELNNIEENVSHELIASCLEYLIDYSNSHLASEERIMEEEGYPGIVPHKAKHNYYRQRMMEEQKKFIEADENWDLYKLAAFLKAWWTEHIEKEDKRYKIFFQNNCAEIEAKILSERWRNQI
jgi:hemerythrin